MKINHRHFEITSIIVFVIYCSLLLFRISVETIRITDNIGYLVIPIVVLPIFLGYVGADFFLG